MPEHEIESGQKRVRNLVDSIWEGNIKIPDFQRSFVWDIDQIVRLLDSVYNDYPIGSILLWETKEHLDSLRNVGGIKLPDPEADYPVKYVLDGQQRLSSLFGVMHHDAEDTKREKSGVGVEDYEKFDIYFDIYEENFKHASDIPNLESRVRRPVSLFEEKDSESGSDRYIDMNKIRQPDIFFKNIQGMSSEKVNKAHNLFTKFEGYQIPIVTVKGREESEVGTIFERINNTGTDLNTLDLMIAWTWSSDFDLREEINEILEIADERGFGDISHKKILQCISAIAVERITEEDIHKSLKQPERIETLLRKVKSSIKKAIDLLADEFNIHDIKFLPSSFQIIPLVYFFSNTERVTSRQVDYARKWFWRTSFTTRYRDATNRRVRDDIAFFDDVSSTNEEVSFDKFDVEITSPQFFLDTKFHSRATAAKAFILMLTQKEPKDLISGERLSIQSTLSKHRKKEYHHVFPRQMLKDRNIDMPIIDSLVNICLIKSESNKSIGKKPPSRYLFDPDDTLFENPGKSDSKKQEILKSNLLPTDLDIYRNDDFEGFVNARKGLLYDYYRNFI